MIYICFQCPKKKKDYSGSEAWDWIEMGYKVPSVERTLLIFGLHSCSPRMEICQRYS
jgi:hypothetical protein